MAHMGPVSEGSDVLKLLIVCKMSRYMLRAERIILRLAHASVDEVAEAALLPTVEYLSNL
jgi:hypothetical protein